MVNYFCYIYCKSMADINRTLIRKFCYRCNVMHKCGICCRDVSVCLSVCLPVMIRYCVKTAEPIVEILLPPESDKPNILVFCDWYWRYEIPTDSTNSFSSVVFLGFWSRVLDWSLLIIFIVRLSYRFVSYERLHMHISRPEANSLSLIICWAGL